MARSERVKSMDFHPTEPWILASLYDGHAYIWNYETQVSLKLHGRQHRYLVFLLLNICVNLDHRLLSKPLKLRISQVHLQQHYSSCTLITQQHPNTFCFIIYDF